MQGDSEVHLHWKGAAEIVLSCCTSWLDSSGSSQRMTPDKVKRTSLLQLYYLIYYLYVKSYYLYFHQLMNGQNLDGRVQEDD
jgi:hypothetical protein